jgi:hypothetical protein
LYERVGEGERGEAADEEQWAKRDQGQERKSEERAQESDGKDVWCVWGGKSEVENARENCIMYIGARRFLVDMDSF